MGLEALDFVIIGVYVVVVAAICYCTARASQSASEFFLSNKNVGFLAVGAAFFASNIGSDSIIGLSSAGATAGLSSGFFDLTSALAFIVLAYGFLPVYRASGSYTLPQWSEHRFGPAVRVYLSVLALLIYVVNRVSASLYCGGLIFSVMLGLNEWVSVGLLLLATGMTVVAGGLHSIIVVENVNTVLLLVGGLLTVGFALQAAGGWGEVFEQISSSQGEAVKAGLPPSFLHIWQGQPLYPALGLVLGGPWLIGWFHLAEQEMVQRGLSAASAGDAALGCIVAGLLKITIPFTWALPGLVSRLLFPKALGCPDGKSMGEECTNANSAFPVLALRVLPAGLLGLMMAAMLAAVLSVLASTFNSASTIFVFDIAVPARKAGWCKRGAACSCCGEWEDDEEEPSRHGGEQRRKSGAPRSVGNDEGAEGVRTHLDDELSAREAVATDTAAGAGEEARLITEAREDTRGSDAKMVLLGRAWVVVMVVLGVLWIPALSRLSDSLYVSMQTLNALLAPPVLAVFVLGVLWPRVHENGALAGLVAGHLPGLARLIMGTVEGTHPKESFTQLNYLYFAAIEGFVTMAVAIAVSVATSPRKSPIDVSPFVLPCALRLWARCAPRLGLGGDEAEAKSACFAACSAWAMAREEEELILAHAWDKAQAAARKAERQGWTWQTPFRDCSRCCGGREEEDEGESSGSRRTDGGTPLPLPPPPGASEPESQPAPVSAGATSASAAASARGSGEHEHNVLLPPPAASAATTAEPAHEHYRPVPSVTAMSEVRSSQKRMQYGALIGSVCIVAVVGTLFIVFG